MAIHEHKISYLNGARFKRALIAGAKRVISRHDHLNKINVFPVSDSDTGTNISITLSAGLRSVALEQDETVPNILAAFADGTLESARGNSGTIFAQLFQGISDAGATYEEISTVQFIEMFRAGAAHAYKAVSNPVEGTVLTVLNDVSDYLGQLETVPEDFALLFELFIKKANESLQETPEKLKMLKKFGVVDAGAQALVDFFEGIGEFINHGDIKGLQQEITAIIESEFENLHADTSAGDGSVEEYNYRFCTECVIVGEDIDQEKLKAQVKDLGDSLVVAGGKRKTKIHMHVNVPSQLFSLCRQYGKLLNEKADDMFHQVQDAHSKHSDVAIITDSSIDLPKELLDQLNIHVIPIRIHIGDEAYIDGISITPDEFYAIVQKEGVIPKTAHPTYRDFKAKYQFLGSHYKSLISIHLSKTMSNTLNAAELVKRDMPKTTIAVLDSGSTSIGMGLVVQYAAELANAGIAHDEICRRIEDIKTKTKFFAILRSLEYAVKGGRVPKAAKTVADLLGIMPIMQVNHVNKPKIIGMIRNKSKAIEKFAKKIHTEINPSKRYRIAISHCLCPEDAQQLLDLLLAELHNIESSLIVPCGVTIGSHSGPGTLGIALQEVEKI